MVAQFRHFGWGKKLALALCALLVLGSGLFFYGVSNLNPIMISMAEARGRQLAVEAINKAVREVMQSGIGYTDLVQVTQDKQGQVTMIQANTLLMNDIASRAALQVQRNLQALGNEGVELPLGSALGIGLFSGSGPRIRVSVVPVGSVATRFATAFESAGINQTRHQISLMTNTQVRIVIPTGADTVQVEASVPVAESIIVGEVPQTYLNATSVEQMLDLVP